MDLALPTASTTAAPVPEQLRWIASYLDVADKAISIIACVEGIHYPGGIQRDAQRDLRAWAEWIEAHRDVAIELDVARLIAGIGEAVPSAGRQ